MKEDLYAPLDFFQLLLAHRNSDRFLFQTFHLADKPAIYIGGISLQSDFGRSDELAHGRGRLGSILNLIPVNTRNEQLVLKKIVFHPGLPGQAQDSLKYFSGIPLVNFLTLSNTYLFQTNISVH